MQHPVKKYHGWLLEEKDKSRKYKEKEDRAKVVFKPIDDSSFLVKYKRQAIIDGQKRLNGQPTIQGDKVVLPDPAYLNAGWKETLSFLRRATTEGKGPSSELMGQIESVGKTMIAVYEVSRKLLTPNRIVITYSLYKKSDFKPVIADVNITTLDADTAGKYATTPEIAAKIRDRVLNIDSQAEVIAQQIQREEEAAAAEAAKKPGSQTDVSTTDQSTGKKIKIDGAGPQFEKLKYLGAKTDLFNVINSAISKIARFSRRGEEGIHDMENFKKSEDELDNGRVGNYTIAVLAALKTAYKISTTDERGRSVHLFNQDFADKISEILNAKDVGESKRTYTLDPLGKFLVEARLYEDGGPYGLDDLLGVEVLAKFKEELKKPIAGATASTSTPEELSKIPYPLKYGIKKNEDLKKVQRLILDKFEKTDLGQALNVDPDKSQYAKFVNTDRDDGGYGDTVKWAVDTLGYILAASDSTINTNAGKEINKKFVDALYKYNTPPNK